MKRITKTLWSCAGQQNIEHSPAPAQDCIVKSPSSHKQISRSVGESDDAAVGQSIEIAPQAHVLLSDLCVPFFVL